MNLPNIKPFLAGVAFTFGASIAAATEATSFADYLKQTAASPAANAFLAGDTLTPAEQRDIQRALGKYTRERYGDEALEHLTELVAIPSFRSANVEQHENPAFIALGEKIQTIAEEFGLAFRNVDNRVFEITLPGATDELIGIHAHGDVVPVNPKNWVLDDGTQLDPFKVTRIGNRLYGRGTEDDKNGIIVSLYAMKVIHDEKLPINRTFKLLIDTTEETTSTAIPYYFERNPTPDYNLALDGGYPVVIAEKGYGLVNASFAVTKGEGKGLEFVDLTGGLASNQIPKVATTRIITDKPSKWHKRLEKVAKRFIKDQGGNFTIEFAASDKAIDVTVTGVSAHSSDPASGVNPVSRLLLFIDHLNENMSVKHNHITQAASYVADNWGTDYYCKKLGIDFSDQFMGPLTCAVTQVVLSDSVLELAVNLRVPKGKPLNQLQQELESSLDQWTEKSQSDWQYTVKLIEPMYRNPKGKWVNALLDVATENLNLPREFASSAGATSVHFLPNGVQFGLSMPGVKYTGHNANEFKTIEQFMLDLQIVTEMMLTIGQLPELN